MTFFAKNNVGKLRKHLKAVTSDNETVGERRSRKPEQASVGRTAIDNEFEKKKETNISRIKTNYNAKEVVSDTKMRGVDKRNKERYTSNNEMNIETKNFNNEINETHEDPVNDSRMIDEEDGNPLEGKTVALKME